MKDQLSKLNEQIKFFSKLAEEFPEYNKLLTLAVAKRTELVSQIGHKKMVMRTRRSNSIKSG